MRIENQDRNRQQERGRAWRWSKQRAGAELTKCFGIPMQAAVPHSSTEPAWLKQDYVGAVGPRWRGHVCVHISTSHCQDPARTRHSQLWLVGKSTHSKKTWQRDGGPQCREQHQAVHASPAPSPVLEQLRGVQRKPQIFIWLAFCRAFPENVCSLHQMDTTLWCLDWKAAPPFRSLGWIDIIKTDCLAKPLFPFPAPLGAYICVSSCTWTRLFGDL